MNGGTLLEKACTTCKKVRDINKPFTTLTFTTGEEYGRDQRDQTDKQDGEIEEQLFISFRATTTVEDVETNLKTNLVDMGNIGKVHEGFYTRFNTCHKSELKDIIKNTKAKLIVFTGHSLGGALATVAALYFSLANPEKKIGCITFGAPKVGNTRLKSYFIKHVLLARRYVNARDWVPLVHLGIGYVHFTDKITISKKYFEHNPHSLKIYCACES